MSASDEKNAALERMLLDSDFAGAVAASLAIREREIGTIEARAIADPTAENIARAEQARADLDDTRRDHKDAMADLEVAEAEYARLAAATPESAAPS